LLPDIRLWASLPKTITQQAQLKPFFLPTPTIFLPAPPPFWKNSDSGILKPN